jgi:segregation and condensation protein A
MATEEEYNVSLEVFEGPLDLLLYLIKQDELDVHNIPIERVTKQYLEYLNLMTLLDLNIAGEFLVMSATLMLIKSRMLLPEEERPELEEEDEDPRLDLVRQLVEYKKFKDAAGHLDDLETAQHNVFYRKDEEVELGTDSSVGLRDVGIFDLISAFHVALERAREAEVREIFEEPYTVPEQIDVLVQRLKTEQRIVMDDVFKGMKHRQEIICTFLAMLELMRLKHIRATHEDPEFSEGHIVIETSEESFNEA